MRKSIYIDGMNHGKNPVPAASLVRNILVSGGVFGMDPLTGTLAPTPEKQCSLMFEHIQSILAEAGATTDDIVKITFYSLPDIDREIINREWRELFPDPAMLPSRHVKTRSELPPGMFMQSDFIAVLES